MQPDRFTIKAQEALAAAARLAQERRNPQLTPVHLLAALLDNAGPDVTGTDRSGIVLPVLTKLGTSIPALTAEVDRALDALPVLGEGSAAEETRPSGEFTAVLRAADEQARALSDQYMSTEHLLLALAADEGRAG